MLCMSWLLNLIIPGSGLILHGREWLGFLLALMFGICANISIAGFIIAPSAFPRWIVWLAVVFSISFWTAAQLFLRETGPRAPAESRELNAR